MSASGINYPKYIPFIKKSVASEEELDEALSIRVQRRQRYYVGAQMTIYLECDSQIMISPEIVLQMITEVSEVLRKNGILPGSKPVSDVSTVSDYFSMRNDAIVIARFFSDDAQSFVDCIKKLWQSTAREVIDQKCLKFSLSYGSCKRFWINKLFCNFVYLMVILLVKLIQLSKNI